MECHPMLALSIMLLLNHINPCAAAAAPSSKANTQYIKTSCSMTLYPALCYTSLSIYAEKIKTSPKVLAHTALNVSLAATKATSVVINRCSRLHGLKAIEAAATLDCVEEVSDALDELRESIDEFGHAVKGSRNFPLQISDVQTWVSAALTDEDTCMDGFDKLNGKVETVIRKEILKISRLTSNALALINNYASN
ncbi:21 kDa protein [Argentina anserina]|uniref:21 kDa protein n=1 Tax=Argentina anserina TaxID=57926 RepID=UPI00217685A6|nr:21 kDa protein [Potentilla anserina]